MMQEKLVRTMSSKGRRIQDVRATKQRETEREDVMEETDHGLRVASVNATIHSIAVWVVQRATEQLEKPDRLGSY